MGDWPVGGHRTGDVCHPIERPCSAPRAIGNDSRGKVGKRPTRYSRGWNFILRSKNANRPEFSGEQHATELGVSGFQNRSKSAPKVTENCEKHPSGDHFWTVGHPPRWSKPVGQLNTIFQNPRQIDTSPNDFGVIRGLLAVFFMAQYGRPKLIPGRLKRATWPKY